VVQLAEGKSRCSGWNHASRSRPADAKCIKEFKVSEYFYLGRNRASIPKRAAIDAALLRLAPAIPPHERTAVVDHAIDSRGLSVASPETAAWLSLVAYVRHTFTDYDDLLAEGYDPDSARHFVTAEMESILQAWGVRRRLARTD
jgi:hypothetical protein